MIKKLLTTDLLAVCGFAAVCFGCWLHATWLAFVVGGVMLIVYAWLHDSAKAFQAMRKGNRE